MDVVVRFEAENLRRTVAYVLNHKLDAVEPENIDDLPGYLASEVERMLAAELKSPAKKDFLFFEHLCHHPIQGVACMYILGDEPKEAAYDFSVPVNNRAFSGNLVACLYTYLI